MKIRLPLAAECHEAAHPGRAGERQVVGAPDRLRRVLHDQHDAERREQLQKLGWIEGRNLRLDFRFGFGDAAQTRVFAADLVQLAPDVVAVVKLEATRQRRDAVASLIDHEPLLSLIVVKSMVVPREPNFKVGA